jgi:DNA-binding response OmpR family regulator
MVESSKTILFADNDPSFLLTRVESLENKGYHVLKAFTLEEARRLLTEAYVHLAILDIRMVNDDDEKDVSGLTLAKEPAYRSIPKIILTGFPSVPAVKEALRPALDGLPPAVDFVAKSDGPDAMIQAAEQAFAQHVHVNWDLEIQWDQRAPLSFPHLASLLQPDLPGRILVYRAGELEDLVCCLFCDYQQVRFGRLLWHDSQRFCLPVLARSSRAATDLRILVCGDRELLARERERMEELTPKTFQGTKLDDKAETVHFGAHTYVLPNADVETVQTLRDLFQVGKERSLKTAFAHLGDVLKAWHQHGQMVQETGDLMSLYRQWVGLTESDVPRTEMEQRVASLVQIARTLGAVEIKRDSQVVTFHFPNQSPIRYPDPVATVYAPLVQYNAPVVCRVSPGRLTAENVLVDAEQRTWLTDFARADQAPQWWDYICLEATTRFDLSQAPDLLAWQEFEECLVKPARLGERLEQRDVIPELRTNIALIEQIRRQAGSEAGPDPLPYYAGLLAWAVGAIAHYDPGVLYTQADRLRGAHLLLAASMIAGRLGETPASFSPEGTLRLDDDGSVWVGDHCVASLVGQEFDLLHCLLEHALEDQFVSRQTLVESVFREKYVAGDVNQESRINSLVSRLRDKIELDQKNPRVLTVKGKGYRLRVS